MLDWIKTLFTSDGIAGQAVDPETLLMLRESLRECEAIYRSSAHLCASVCPERISGDREKYVELMLDLHRGLLVKILVEIAQCDREWHAAERDVAMIVL